MLDPLHPTCLKLLWLSGKWSTSENILFMVSRYSVCYSMHDFQTALANFVYLLAKAMA